MTYATVAASNAQRVHSYGQSRGIDVALPMVPSPAPTVTDRIPADRMYGLWSELARVGGGESLSIELAERSQIEDLDVLGYAIVTAPSVADALATFVKFSALLNDSGHYELLRDGRAVHLRYFGPEQPSLGVRLSRETAFAQIVRGIRQLTGGHLDPLAMSFRHEPPSRTRLHREFFGCSVQFGASVDCLTFCRELLDVRPPSANVHVWRYLCRQADQLLRQLGPRPLPARVRATIEQGLAAGSPPEIARAAAAVGMSERSLRRALWKNGTTYRTLVDGVRRERAKALLEQASVSITQAAFECGFAEASAFTHACIRWFGRSPRELRRR